MGNSYLTTELKLRKNQTTVTLPSSWHRKVGMRVHANSFSTMEPKLRKNLATPFFKISSKGIISILERRVRGCPIERDDKRGNAVSGTSSDAAIKLLNILSWDI